IPVPLATNVRAGSSTQASGGIVVPVLAIAIHPDYTSNADSSNNDIAVLTLLYSLTVGPTIGPISLPNINEEVSTGTPAVVSGWGYLTEGSSSPTQLQAVTVPIVDRNECNVSYSGMITDRMICAGVPEGGKDSCQGDSGGPLVASGKLAGLVSWGKGCARPGYPGVYTNIAAPAIRATSLSEQQTSKALSKIQFQKLLTWSQIEYTNEILIERELRSRNKEHY
ncbi:hypothetical protein ILUMI_17224, partial [Ignelater luminosus]